MKAKTFACEACDVKFSGPSGLWHHNKKKHEGVRHNRNECDQVFDRPTNLKLQRESTHFGIKYSCTRCKYKSQYKSDLKLHEDTKHDGKTSKINRTTRLKAHIELVHELARYSCEFCDFKATKKETWWGKYWYKSWKRENRRCKVWTYEIWITSISTDSIEFWKLTRKLGCPL